MSHAPNDDSSMGDDLPDDLAAPAEPDSSGSRSVGRRPFMKGAMVGAGSLAAGGFSLRYGTREAEALAVTTAVGIAVGGAAIGYLMNEAADKYLGDERDYSDYTGGDALKTEIRTGALNMKSADERVMTSIQNNLTTSQNVALAKGKAAIVEAMNAEKTESEATTAMQEAIDGYYSTIQKNILTHYNAQISQVSHHIDQVEGHENLSLVGSFYGQIMAASTNWYDAGFDSVPPEASPYSIPVDLLDGSTSSLSFILDPGNGILASQWFKDNYTTEMQNEASADFTGDWASDKPKCVRITNPDGSSETVDLINQIDTSSNTVTDNIGDAWQATIDERDSVNSILSGFVTDVYNNWSAGDIPTEDLVDPITASTELSQNYDGYQAQGAHAAMLGIPTTAEQSVNLTVHTADGDRNIWADIYTEYVPTDGSGNEIGFESGTTYDPSTWDKPLYIAYEYTEETQDGTTTETDFVQLEDSFTIDVIEDKDGNEVDSFKTTSRNNQTADVSKLKEELDQLREAQLDMQEEAQSGGGGSFIDDLGFGGIPGEGVLVGIVGIIVVLLGQSD